MSLYADYLRERTFDHIYETDNGFATYRFIDDGKAVYIIDIYVAPEHRRSGLMSQMADIIVETAKKQGCIELIGTVSPAAKGSTESIQALIGYGMTLKSSHNDVIVFTKGI